MKIAIVETLGIEFMRSKLRFSLYMKSKGLDVTAIIPDDGFCEEIENHGIKVIKVDLDIRRTGLKNLVNYAFILKRIFKDNEFSLIHFTRFQPNIVGGIIAGLSTQSKIVIQITGLGESFSNHDFESRIRQFIILKAYRFVNLISKPYVIYQNKEDREEVGIFKKSSIIKGSAVNEEIFCQSESDNCNLRTQSLKSNLEITSDTIVFIYVSRIVKEKGILDLIEGFKEALKQTDKELKLLIVGGTDKKKRSGISSKVINELIEDYSAIQYLGRRNDVDLLLKLSDVAILPTYYREGTPRFLLEAMALKKALITTDMPGCNHLLYKDKPNGILITPKKPLMIKDAVLDILNSNLKELGENSYYHYHKDFSEERVYGSNYEIYTRLLNL